MKIRNLPYILILFLFLFVPPFTWGDTDISSYEKAEEYFLKGRTYLQEGNEIRASEFFDKAIGIDKRYIKKISEEYFKAGRLLIKDPGKSNIGFHFLTRALKAQPEKRMDIAYILRSGGFHLLDKNKFMAHVLLQKAIELNPSFARDDLFYFTFAVRSAHKSPDVITGGKDFIKKFPSSRYIPEALYMIGQAYVDVKNRKEAEVYFNRLKKEFPDTEWTKKLPGVEPRR